MMHWDFGCILLLHREYTTSTVWNGNTDPAVCIIIIDGKVNMELLWR
jgi:hypothetical protein